MRFAGILKLAGAAVFALVAATASAFAQEAVVTLPDGQDSATITVNGQSTVVANGSAIDTSQDIGTGGHEIVLTLSDGSAIAVTPGTTFTFSVSPSGVPTLNIQSGSARVVSAGGNIAISTPDGTTVTGTDVAAQVNSDGTSSVGSNSGQATVTTAAGTSTTVDAGSAVTVQAGGTITPSSSPLQVGSANLNTTLTTASVPPTGTTPTPAPQQAPTIVSVVVVENALQDAGEGSPQQ